MNSGKLAKLLSVVLGPQVWLPVFLLIFIFKTGLTREQITVLLPTLLVFQVFIPLGYLYFAFKSGKVADLDLTKREERHVPLIVSLISWLISLVLVCFFGNQLLLHLYLIIFVLIIITTVITKFWKISLHMSINTLGSILVNFLFNWKFPFLYFSIPLVFWARLRLKKHTVNQLLAGFIINAVFILTALRFFNYI